MWDSKQDRDASLVSLDLLHHYVPLWLGDIDHGDIRSMFELNRLMSFLFVQWLIQGRAGISQSMHSKPLLSVTVSEAKQDLNWSSQRKPRVLSGRIEALHSYSRSNIKRPCLQLLQPFLINEGSHGRQSKNN